jgi:hypothetical protein
MGNWEIVPMKGKSAEIWRKKLIKINYSQKMCIFDLNFLHSLSNLLGQLFQRLWHFYFYTLLQFKSPVRLEKPSNLDIL